MNTHGKHIKIVGHADPSRLGSPSNINEFLHSVVSSLGMRMLGNPQIHDVEVDIKKLKVEPFEDEGGVTGVAVLSTSHVSIHTWPVRNFFVLDVYSCRDFESTTVLEVIESHFGKLNVRLTDVSNSLLPPAR